MNIHKMFKGICNNPKHEELLANIKKNHKKLKSIYKEAKGIWVYEDKIYRYYCQSMKVFHLPRVTKEIVDALQLIAPKGNDFNEYFKEIIEKGAVEIDFDTKYNENWSLHSRVFVEAYFHSIFFLEMTIKYGKKLRKPPKVLPSGWAALIALYDLW